MQVKFLSREVLSNRNGKVKAVIGTEVTFDDASKPILHKQVVSCIVAPSAPEKRVYRRLNARAEAEITAFFNGDDVDNPNMFSNWSEEPKRPAPTHSEELGPQHKLRAVEKECSVAA